MKKCAPFALALLLALPLAAAAQMTESMGSYQTPEQKAMAAYGRGLKLKKKAEAEKDPAKQAKLYEKAKEELTKSVAYMANYDGFLALGQVYLVLGQKQSALDTCHAAKSLKPNDAAAKGCMEEAQRQLQQAGSEKPQDDGP